MVFESSQVSLTSKIQYLSLASYETHKRGVKEVTARLAASLLSPAAAVDFTLHLSALPFAFVYALGKSVYQQRADLSISWQHLQRVREAVFPVFFGSIFGLLHPYFGIYATEPKAKHIAVGYLLSNSSQGVSSVISPVAAYREAISSMDLMPKESRLPKEFRKLTKEALDWEKSLEQIQSLEMFDLKLTSVVMQRHQSRVALVAYPIFAAIDLTFSLAVSTLFLLTGAVQMIGGYPPAYLETTNSPTLHMYRLTKTISDLVGLTLGFFVSLTSRKKGAKFINDSTSSLNSFFLNFQFKKLEKRINSLKDKEQMLLPIVIQNRLREDSELEIIPGFDSHTACLLIEKKEGNYRAELIERGLLHGAKSHLSREDVLSIAKNCIRLRFPSTKTDPEIYLNETFSEKNSLIDLGQTFGG